MAKINNQQTCIEYLNKKKGDLRADINFKDED